MIKLYDEKTYKYDKYYRMRKLINMIKLQDEKTDKYDKIIG